MKVLYNKDINILGLGLVPWSRIGPEKWFNNFTIASLYDWDANTNIVVSPLQKYTENKLNIKNTQGIIDHELFKNKIAKFFKNYKVLTYKPVIEPRYFRDYNLDLINKNSTISKCIENKAYFRTKFSNTVKFPKYKIFEISNLEESYNEYSDLHNEFGIFVIQDEILSDGRGTFIVKNYEDYETSIKKLRQLNKGRKIIISKFIKAQERSVQCVVTKYGIFVGPLQKQIISNELLVDTKSKGGSKFCGAEVTETNKDDYIYLSIKDIASKIGSELQTDGYKGIFGIDFLVDKSGDVYVLEVNARVTGATPLLTMLQDENSIPFYLLHILELLGAEYKIVELENQVFNKGSMLLLHNKESGHKIIKNSPRSGNYNNNQSYVSSCINFDGDNNIVVHQYLPIGTSVVKDSRLLTIYSKADSLDDMGNLNNHSVGILENYKGQISLEQEKGARK